MSFGMARKITSFLAGLAALVVLSGCGKEGHSAESNPPGLFIDTSTERFLQKAFDETKACAGITEGKYEDVSVILMPPVFPCPHYADGCSGEYVRPNSFKVGALSVWRHEVLHYLLDLKTGDPDVSHTSPLFRECT